MVIDARMCSEWSTRVDTLSYSPCQCMVETLPVRNSPLICLKYAARHLKSNGIFEFRFFIFAVPVTDYELASLNRHVN